MPDATTLRIAIGDYPHTLPLKRGAIVSPWLKLDFVEIKPMHKAFKPMVREHAYDASEIALVTYLQAKAYNKGCLLYTSDAADDLLCVDLGGRRIIKKKKKQK